MLPFQIGKLSSPKTLVLFKLFAENLTFQIK